MHDTSPEVMERYRTMLLERSNEERLLMGVSMFESARAMIRASLPSGLSALEIQREMLLRIYGNELDAETLQKVLAEMSRSSP